MKRKTFLFGTIFAAVLLFTLFLSMPASASTISINWNDSFVGWGTLDTSPGGQTVISFNSGTPAADSSAPSEHTPVPSALLLLASGLVGVAAFRKKFRR
jgi:hypothetical protein